MGRIFYIIGRSASGKDRLQREMQQRFGSRLKTVLMYTTRPLRSGETDGVAYHFISGEQFEAYKAAGRVIEYRQYQTVYGPWIYATLDDGQIDLKSASYLVAGTPESYLETRNYFGREAVVPLYIHVEDGALLLRALKREMAQEQPKYAEMCRRYLADDKDFAPEKLAALELPRVYENDDFDRCAAELAAVIEEGLR